ncbi:MAG: glycerate kinase [Marinilabiliaceae bacterium]|nr:glycerate kinase [Marinilabiliaceae bacterium]
MKVFICPDSFKGTFTSAQVVQYIYKELSKSEGLECRTSLLADGGEGSLELLTKLPEIRKVPLEVHDPLGRLMGCEYLIKREVAFIELAAASGLTHLKFDQLDPFRTSTLGTGELIKDTLLKGCKEINLFLGGSATVDGGAGIVEALSPFRRQTSPHVGMNPLMLTELITIDHLKDLLRSVKINLVTDVSNCILGPDGAVAVFGPQKGASEDQLVQLEAAMDRWVNYLQLSCGKPLNNIDGLGAAGGAGLPLYAFADCEVMNGFAYFNQLLDYESLIRWADVVITGEGCIDHQTMMGKGPGEIARMAKSAGKYVIGIGGIVKQLPEGFDKVFSTADQALSERQLKTGAESRLIKTLQDLRQFLLGLSMNFR